MRLTTLVNVAAVVVGLTLAGFVVMALLRDNSTPPCSTRYPAATGLALKGEKGGLLSPSELQARVGTEEWGVLENARVLAIEGAPSPLVLEVTLPKDSGSAFQSRAPKGGVGFRWKPAHMAGATGACLSYKVWLPEDFDFAQAGVLPGLFGGPAYDPLVKSDGKNGFATRIMWREHGTAEVSAQLPSEEAALSRAIDAGKFVFPRGRWVAIEHEVVLNGPAAKDGVVRLWVDGVLKVERDGLIWRATDAVTLSGVLADVSYGGIDSPAVAPKTAALRLSPLEMSWR